MSSNRKCIFCAKPNKLSREHIFGQWLLKELDIYDEQVAMSHVSLIGIPLSERKHSFSNLVNGLVCEECNNGWMSTLENECKSHIINLMNLNDEEVKNEITLLSDHSTEISKWAFKNAIMLNSATNYRSLVPTSHFLDLYNGTIPKGVFIDLAFSSEDMKLTWRQSPGAFIIKDRSIPFNPNACKYRIAFQLKHLLVKITYLESPYSTFYEDDGAIRIHPEVGIIDELKIFSNIDKFDVNGVMHEYIEQS